MFETVRAPFPALGEERLQRAIRLALVIASALAATALALVLAQGITNVGFALKAAAGAAVAAVAIALAVRRPILFPFVAFAAAVPFDNLLQTGGGTLTKFLGAASGGLVLAVMLTDRRRTIAPAPAVAGWAVFLAWSVASLMWADDPLFGLPSLAQVALLFALYAIFSMLRPRPAEVRALMSATLIGGVAAAVYGFYMYHSGHVARTDPLSQRLDISLGAGTYINADHFGGALVFPMAIALVGFLRLDGWRRWASAGACIVLLAGVLASATRGSLIAVGVMGAYLAVIERRRLSLLVIGGLGLVSSAAMPNIWLRFLDPDQGGLGGRTGIWAIGMNAFRDHWLAGAGTGNFRVAYGEAYLRTAQHGAFYHRWAEDSHNLIINTGVELGILGIAIMLFAWVLQFRVVAKIPRDSELGAVRAAIEAGTLGLFVVAMAVDLMWYKYLWIAFILAVLARNAAFGRTSAR